MPTVNGYVRVSTNAQAQSGNGLWAQQAAIRKAYEQDWYPKGYVWGAYYEDGGVSGNTPLANRPAGRKLQTALSRGDVVIFSKLDRGFRNTLDCLQTVSSWNKRGVKVQILDIPFDLTTPVGEMVLGVMAMVARFERARLGERLSESHRARIAKGECPFYNPPYPFKAVGKIGTKRKLAYDHDLREVAKKVIEWRELGFSWDECFWHLHKGGIRRADGSEYGTHALRRIVVEEAKLLAQEKQAREKLDPAGEKNPGPRV